METNEYSRYISRTAFSEMKGSSFDDSFYSSDKWNDDFEYVGDYETDESGEPDDEELSQNSATKEEDEDAAEEYGEPKRSAKKGVRRGVSGKNTAKKTTKKR